MAEATLGQHAVRLAGHAAMCVVCGLLFGAVSGLFFPVVGPIIGAFCGLATGVLVAPAVAVLVYRRRFGVVWAIIGGVLLLAGLAFTGVGDLLGIHNDAMSGARESSAQTSALVAFLIAGVVVPVAAAAGCRLLLSPAWPLRVAADHGQEG